VLAGDYAKRKLLYSVNGGKSWMSRPVTFPASVNAFTFPSRRRAYAVGDNGMVFRYSVVPATYAGKQGSLAAPAMPGGASAVATQATSD
jgi:hypothetical protein